MNVVMIVTSGNIRDMAETMMSIGEMQETKVNGALVICHEIGVKRETIAEFIDPLVRRFAAAQIMSVNVSSSATDEKKNGLLFFSFIGACYCKYPGPWLVIDSLAIASCKNPVDAMETHHRIGGKMCCSKVLTYPTAESIDFCGPTVIGLPYSSVSRGGFNINSSWKDRMRGTMNSGVMYNIPSAGYPFSLVRGRTREFVDVPVFDGELPDLSEMSDDELDSEYLNTVGKSPHPRAKRETKIARILELR